MALEKDIEILEINLKEAGKKMPPDVRVALEHSIKSMQFVVDYGYEKEVIDG